MRQIGWISRWMGVAVAAALAFAPQGLSAAGAAQAIGVPDFAARPSTPTMSGLNPGRFAADAATMELTRRGAPRVHGDSAHDHHTGANRAELAG